jgi:hypothetical protein
MQDTIFVRERRCEWCSNREIDQQSWDECMDAICSNTIDPKYALRNIEKRIRSADSNTTTTTTTSLYDHLATHDPISRFPSNECWACCRGLFRKADFTAAGLGSMWDMGKHSCRTPKDYNQLERQYREAGACGLQTHFEYHTCGW